MDFVDLVLFFRASGLVTILAERLIFDLTMFLGRAFVDRVAAHTGETLLAVQHDVADIGQHVTIRRIEMLIVSPGKIDLEVPKQIVTGDEIVWVRPSGTLRLARAKVALPTD